MLNEVLENSKNKLIQIIKKSEGLQERKIELERKMQETKDSILKLNQENRSLSIYRKRNPIIEFLMRTFSKQYKLELKTSVDNSQKLSKLNEEIANLRSEKRKLDLDEQTLNPENAKKKLEKMENEDIAINFVVNENPDLAKNPEFMKDLIERDIRYIKFDKSNNTEVYEKYIEKFLPKLEEVKDRTNTDQTFINLAINNAERLLDELRNPKQVEDGKYKIPKRFLFEGLRKTCDEDLECIASGDVADLLYAGREYLREDGNYSIKYGKQMESLYEDKDNFFITHYINASNHLRSTEGTHDIRDSIYKEGLHSSTQGEDCINVLKRTAHGNFEEDKYFMGLMVPDHKIIIMLPRKLLAKNAEEPIWNSDFPEADTQHPGYISPEYVYGYINPFTEEIEENPVPVADRKKYKYHFLDGQTTSVEDRVKY